MRKQPNNLREIKLQLENGVKNKNENVYAQTYDDYAFEEGGLVNDRSKRVASFDISFSRADIRVRLAWLYSINGCYDHISRYDIPDT